MIQGGGYDERYQKLPTRAPIENEAPGAPGNDRGTIAMPRGKVLGGTNSTNATPFIRGAPEDHNGWAVLGRRGWDFETVLPPLPSVGGL